MDNLTIQGGLKLNEITALRTFWEQYLQDVFLGIRLLNPKLIILFRGNFISLYRLTLAAQGIVIDFNGT